MFGTKETNAFNSYARTCQANNKRTPIILTDKEKKAIDKDFPDAYNEKDGTAIYYGDAEKHWYICPRYWCLLTNKPMTEEQVKAGECGGEIIPEKAKEIPEGKYIYEFNSHKAEHIDSKTGKYVKHYPGYLDGSKHPKGLCAPCCFKNKQETPAMKARKVKCELAQSARDKGSVVDEKLLEPAELSKVTKAGILAHTTFPLPPDRLGFMPPSVEIFLDIKQSDYFVKHTKKIIINKKHLLRIGVEKNEKQSFVAAIAKLYSIIYKTNVDTIVDFKKKLISHLTLDNFLSFQNGNLFEVFLDDDIDLKLIDVKKYNKTFIYKNLMIGIVSKETGVYFRKLCYSFESFIKYIESNDNLIDHTYLWDIVTNENGIFHNISDRKGAIQGVNMIILNVLDNDNTSNIGLICPSNLYTTTKFIMNKRTIILLKHDEYYEPIAIYYDTGKKYQILGTLSKFDNDPSSTHIGIQKLFKLMQTIMNKCKPINSIPSFYEMKKNVTLGEMLKIFDNFNDKVTKSASLFKVEAKPYEDELKKQIKLLQLVMNYNAKIIGIVIIIAGFPEEEYFIPCYGTSILDSKIIESIGGKIILLDDIELKPYLVRKAELEAFGTKFSDIYIKPKLKLVEDGNIVGIITEADQFVPVFPQENIEDELEELESNNYIEVDKKLRTSQDIQDKKRLETVKNIKMETLYYKIFRSIVKKEINKYENMQIRSEILDIIKNTTLTNSEKRNKIIEILKTTLKEIVSFVKHNKNTINEVYELNECYDKNEDDCNLSLCSYSNNKCKVLFPKKNLTNDLNNNELYFNKISDELVRYSRVQKYIFTRNVYLSLEDVKYKLNNDEMLVYESELSQTYLREISEQQNKGSVLIKNINEMSKPDKSTTFLDNTIYLDQLI